MHDPDLLRSYTNEVLRFSLKGAGDSGRMADALSASERVGIERFAKRVPRALADAGLRHVLLLGQGRGVAAAALAETLPKDATLTVCGNAPDRARDPAAAGRLAPLLRSGRAVLVCDDSDMALFCLLRLAGPPRRETLVVVNPECADQAEKRRWLEFKRLLAETGRIVLEEASSSSGSVLSFAAIVHPDEPGLQDFMRAVPERADQAVFVWDAPEVPDAAGLPIRPDIPAVHLARPLDGDFAAQRNAMLSACEGDWVLYLDADERPGPLLSRLLPRLLDLESVNGVYFPRTTLYPDANRTKIGYGLWPDLQLRLFRPTGNTRFERPVHERLVGLPGKRALALGSPILHLSNLLKDEKALERKHKIFDKAGGATHVQSADYPNLPAAALSPRPGERWDVLLLP